MYILALLTKIDRDPQGKNHFSHIHTKFILLTHSHEIYKKLTTFPPIYLPFAPYCLVCVFNSLLPSQKTPSLTKHF